MYHSKIIRVPKDLDKPRAAANSRRFFHNRTVYLSIFLTELIQQQEANQPLETRERFTRELLRELLGGADHLGILQIEFNAENGGVLNRLQKDIPDITTSELVLFSLVHSGFTNKVMGMLLDLKDEVAVSLLHHRLVGRISRLKPGPRSEYLDFLPHRTCRIGQEMLYLQNM